MPNIAPEIIQTMRDLCTAYKLGVVGLPNQEFLHGLVKSDGNIVEPKQISQAIITYLRKEMRPYKFSPQALQELVDAMPTLPDKAHTGTHFTEALTKYLLECLKKLKKPPFKVREKEVIAIAQQCVKEAGEETQALGHEHFQYTFPELSPTKLYELADEVLDYLELNHLTFEELYDLHPDFTPQPLTPEREEYIRFCLRRSRFEQEIFDHFMTSTGCVDEMKRVADLCDDEYARYRHDWVDEQRDQVFREGGLEALERYDAAIRRANSLSVSDVDVDNPDFLREVQSLSTACKLTLLNKGFNQLFKDVNTSFLCDRKKDDELTPAFLKLLELFSRALAPRKYDMALLDRILKSLATDMDRFLVSEAIACSLCRSQEDSRKAGKDEILPHEDFVKVNNLSERYDHIIKGLRVTEEPKIAFPELGIQYFARS